MAHDHSPAAEALLDKEFPCLNHGFVRMVDYYGTDARIVQSARVSYGSGSKTLRQDAALIRYLVAHRHTSPLEQVVLTFHMKLPIFVARQMIRHRTARCLTGDTIISFDLPGGKAGSGNHRHYPLSIDQLVSRWQPTVNTTCPSKQGNPLRKRQRVQKMRIRCYDEKSKNIGYSHIKDILFQGVREVVRCGFSNGSVLKATPDHVCLTSQGWLPLKEAYDRGVLFASPGKHTAMYLSTPIEGVEEETWKHLKAPYEKYEVSNLGGVRSYATTRGSRREPVLKKQTISPSGYPVVSLSSKGVSRAFFTHRLVLDTFVGERPDSYECRHLNGVRGDAQLKNLAWGTPEENTTDRMSQEGHQRLDLTWVKCVSWEHVGREPVYDLEIEGENHSFVANGIVVHNCNEVSGRYSVMKDEFYLPDLAHINYQSTDNKQGRSGPLPESEAQSVLVEMEADQQEAYHTYTQLIERGVAKELARVNLPLSLYTEWYWQIDLHNLFHFLGLRLDGHAQYEIRVYAEAMAKCAKAVAPAAYAAFEECTLNAITLNAEEVEYIRSVYGSGGIGKEISSKSGQEEFHAKMVKLGLRYER